MNYHVTLRRWTLIFRFCGLFYEDFQKKRLKKFFWTFYKFSDLSRFPANPFEPANDSSVVNVGLDLWFLNQIDAVEQVFDVNLIVELEWTDTR